MNEKFDLPLVRTFQPLMALLGGARDRGENRPVRMTDAKGKHYQVLFGEALKLTKPEYERKETPEGMQYEIKARSHAEARTLLGRVKREHPDFDIEDALQHAAVQNNYPRHAEHTVAGWTRHCFPGRVQYGFDVRRLPSPSSTSGIQELRQMFQSGCPHYAGRYLLLAGATSVVPCRSRHQSCPRALRRCSASPSYVLSGTL